MKKRRMEIICILVISLLMVSCTNKSTCNNVSSEIPSVNTSITTTAVPQISTVKNSTTEYVEPLGGLTNPYNLYLQKDGTYITYDGKFLCDCDFDPNKEYKVGDTLKITTTLTNLTNEDLYFSDHIGGILIYKLGTNMSFTDGPIRFCESGDTLSDFKEINFKEAGEFIVSIYRTFGVSSNNKIDMIESIFYWQHPSCTYKITVKE